MLISIYVSFIFYIVFLTSCVADIMDTILKADARFAIWTNKVAPEVETIIYHSTVWISHKVIWRVRGYMKKQALTYKLLSHSHT